ncbi:unnamed protein product [Meloidogyne enterolobii]|uniref:Uncharacterized protein n=1 Tax=Meloidogyne enterolobii TaxID=390850 RepID=A0ACB1A4I7_MELEN
MESMLESSAPDNEIEPAVNPAKVVNDLFWLAEQCELRCIFEHALWANEQLNHLPQSHFLSPEVAQSSNWHYGEINMKRRALIMFVRTLMTSKYYHRAKFFLSKSKESDCLEAFLYYHSWYLISIRDRFEGDAEDLETKEPSSDDNISELRSELETLKLNSPHLFDCFLNYLLGLVRLKCDANDMAIQAFSESTIVVGQHGNAFRVWWMDFMCKTWLYNLFVAETMSRLLLFVCAIEAYTDVSKYLGASPYILCQIATAQSELQEHDGAISSFQKIRKSDPYRIEQMHFYSDSLYIRQNFTELALLAKWFFVSHKFNWETCCIVANYYSAKNIHEQAQEFLKRSIMLCPKNASLWVLLGHEYLETKNHQAATSSYKKATLIDKNCYRAWYGLGQLHEIMKQPSNALFYYKKAHKCRPDDSRMLIALGVMFSKLDRKSDAEKCFKKAFQIGDVEGNALIHLAKLYEDQNDKRNAAKAYEAYLTLYTEELVGDLSLIATSCRFLASYYLEQANLDTSYDYAQRCLDYDISKEEGYRILQLIKSKRKETQDKLAKGSYSSTPQTQCNSSTNYRTPSDAPRPIGGGDDFLPKSQYSNPKVGFPAEERVSSIFYVGLFFYRFLCVYFYCVFVLQNKTFLSLSSIQTPFTERKEVNLDVNDDDMNTNSDDDDLEITF